MQTSIAASGWRRSAKARSLPAAAAVRRRQSASRDSSRTKPPARPLYSRVMAYHAITLDDLSWEERDRAADEPPRWHAPVTDALHLAHSRARMWRYGRR